MSAVFTSICYRISMKIESPKPEDVLELHNLFRETWLATYPNIENGITIEDIEDHFGQLDEASLNKRAKNIEIVTEDINQFYKIVRIEGKIVGVIWGRVETDSIYLKSLYILPKYQGQGIGTALFEAFKNWANKDKIMLVSVAIYNANAIAFYSAKGFVDTGRRFSEERFRMKSGSIIPEMEMKYRW